ncbi:reverse transcriptase-like protein [Sphingomonas nostoxanthinifaciens]|uniref:reverse transcriptase-like protein n=1 Tax=Sphingomonas nostoxanthinifaciens TaxID=2872652 RepID=UPI001CC205A9|nr:reverse transcriptase-like protein [Sphingomonas nostoxanthinifaciens]UAK23181.1 reverse transcriptase-like protein [Sphingomonas nostoxanthinifaciens]
MIRRPTFFFDGGCQPNPGPMEIMVVSHGEAHYRCDLGSGDNNEAEWLALRYAVELACAAGVTDALFVGDSALVVAQAAGRQRCRSAHLQPHLAAFRDAVAAIPHVTLKQVARSKNLAGIALARRGHP